MSKDLDCFMVYISRVLEKKPAYSNTVLVDGLARTKEILGGRLPEWIDLWSDGGAHFKSRELMASAAINTMEQ
eukprot:12887605-Prorocentrum_lima.AAC.1